MRPGETIIRKWIIPLLVFAGAWCVLWLLPFGLTEYWLLIWGPAHAPLAYPHDNAIGIGLNTPGRILLVTVGCGLLYGLPLVAGWRLINYLAGPPM